MKRKDLAVFEEFEETAMLGAQKVRQFLLGDSSSKESQVVAKVGAMAMGSYARLRATLANEMHLRLQVKRATQNQLDAENPIESPE